MEFLPFQRLKEKNAKRMYLYYPYMAQLDKIYMSLNGKHLCNDNKH